MDRPSSGDFDAAHEVSDVRMRGFRERISVRTAARRVDHAVGMQQPLTSEMTRTVDAAGRVLARGVDAPCAVPGFDRAAMDGWAVRADETSGAAPYNPVTLKRIGESRPGSRFPGEVGPGQVVGITTGAPVPAGADAVVPAEDAEYDPDEGPDGVVRITAPVTRHRHVSRAGEDVREGARLLDRGRRLRPQDVALLVSTGLAGVPCVRRPRVRIVITGDELLPPGERPDGDAGRIVDSNGPMLEALVRRDGGEPRTGDHVPDDPEELRTVLRESPEDVILVSGGSSVGPEDHAPLLLAEEGHVLFHGVALRPAAPAGFGILPEGRPVFLLPGNPVSCLCAYDLFAARAVRRLAGLRSPWPYRSVRRTLVGKIAGAAGRTEYVRVGSAGDGRVVPIAISGASILSGAVRACGVVLTDHDSEGFPDGAEVDVHLFDDADDPTPDPLGGDA